MLLKDFSCSDGLEDILSSALKTPQILELSGIGRKDVLEKVGIPPCLELPVGENMQEHIYVAISWGTLITP